MRNQKTIQIADVGSVSVKEMTPAHFPQVLLFLASMYKEDAQIDTAHVVQNILKHYDSISGVLQSCTSLDADAFQELGGSDVIDVIEAWVEANSPFFEKLKAKVPDAVGRVKR